MYNIVVSNSGKCVDVPSFSNSNSTQMFTNECALPNQANQANQVWQLISHGEGYKIVKQ